MGALTTTGVVPAVIQNYWDRMFLRRALASIVHGRVAQRRPLRMRSGKQMSFRRYESLPIGTTPLVEGQPPTGRQLTYTDISVLLQQWGDYVPLTDMVEMTTDHPLLNETNRLLSEQSARVIDSLLRDVAAAGTNVFYGGTAAARTDITTTTHKVSTALLDRINRFLLLQNATMFTEMVSASVKVSTFGIRPAWIAVISPEIYYTLQTLSGFRSPEEYGSSGPVMMNEVGAYKNFRFLMTTLAKKWLGGGGTASGDVQGTGGNADVHSILVFGRDAIGNVPLEGASLQNIIKPLGSGGTSDPLNQIATTGWKHTGARIRLNETFMCRAEVAVADVSA